MKNTENVELDVAGYSKERITTAGILMSDDQVFIARRKQGGAIGGQWEFPGGKNREGETIEETLVREFLEEFHVSIRVHEFIHSHDFTNRNILYHLHAYRISPEETFRPLLTVHDEWRWVSLDDLGSYEFAPSDAQIVRSLRLAFPVAT